MVDAVHLILLVGFWLAVIVAAYHQPWWLPVPTGAVFAAIFGFMVAAAEGRASPEGFFAAGGGGAFCGLVVIGLRAVMRKVRRDPFEARPVPPAEKAWAKDEGHGPKI